MDYNYRYIIEDQTDHLNLVDEQWILDKGGRYMVPFAFNPESCVNLCEITPSYLMIAGKGEFVFPKGTALSEAQIEEVRALGDDLWNLSCPGEGDKYIHCHEVGDGRELSVWWESRYERDEEDDSDYDKEHDSDDNTLEDAVRKELDRSASLCPDGYEYAALCMVNKEWFLIEIEDIGWRAIMNSVVNQMGGLFDRPVDYMEEEEYLEFLTLMKDIAMNEDGEMGGHRGFVYSGDVEAFAQHNIDRILVAANEDSENFLRYSRKKGHCWNVFDIALFARGKGDDEEREDFFVILGYWTLKSVAGIIYDLMREYEYMKEEYEEEEENE